MPTYMGHPIPAFFLIFNPTHEWLRGLSNWAPYSVTYENVDYPTAEHLYQALKFLPHFPRIAERVWAQASPGAAMLAARKHERCIDPNWRSVSIERMTLVLTLKLEQHPRVEESLLGTGGVPLIADCDDPFWGTGLDGKGRNELGKIFESIRDRLTVKYESYFTTKETAGLPPPVETYDHGFRGDELPNMTSAWESGDQRSVAEIQGRVARRRLETAEQRIAYGNQIRGRTYEEKNEEFYQLWRKGMEDMLAKDEARLNRLKKYGKQWGC